MPRKAQSAILQIMQNNPNHRTKEQLNKRKKSESKLNFGTENLKPAWTINAGAKKVFEQIVNMYKDTTFLNDADFVTLTQYCDWVAEYIACNNRLKKNGRSQDGKPSGDMRLKLQISSELDRLARELGLTPSARSSLAIHLADDDQNKEAEDDEFDD